MKLLVAVLLVPVLCDGDGDGDGDGQHPLSHSHQSINHGGLSHTHGLGGGGGFIGLGGAAHGHAGGHHQLHVASPLPAAPECTVSYELACANSAGHGLGHGGGYVNGVLDCPSTLEEVCIDVEETVCTSGSGKECLDVSEMSCDTEQEKICIQADQTTCQETSFAAVTARGGKGGGRQCQTVQTQKCGEPVGEQVCADIKQVDCQPETIEICKTFVDVGVREECVHFQEPECRETTDQICFLGYGQQVQQEQECHFVTRPCPPHSQAEYGHVCHPTKEKVCNFVSKPHIHGGAASHECKNLYSQKCTLRPNTRCISVPTVNTHEKCEKHTINNCHTRPGRECLTTYKTECNAVENQEVCFDIPGGSAGTEYTQLTNQFCTGQNKDICFYVDKTVCQKKEKEKCFDIPTTTCQKVPSSKCFTVQTPPKLVQVPRTHCLPPPPPPVVVHERTHVAHPVPVPVPQPVHVHQPVPVHLHQPLHVAPVVQPVHFNHVVSPAVPLAPLALAHGAGGSHSHVHFGSPHANHATHTDHLGLDTAAAVDIRSG